MTPIYDVFSLIPERSFGSFNAKNLALYLASLMDEIGSITVRPYRGEMADELGMSHHALRQAMLQLTERKLIEIEHYVDQGGEGYKSKANYYTLGMEAVAHIESLEEPLTIDEQEDLEQEDKEIAEEVKNKAIIVRQYLDSLSEKHRNLFYNLMNDRNLIRIEAAEPLEQVEP
jgi:DNA-directed RNA polymerase specialized sigma subunit